MSAPQKTPLHKFRAAALPFATTTILLLIIVLIFYQKRLAQNSVAPSIQTAPSSSSPSDMMPLPSPDTRGYLTVESALKLRKTRRSFLDEPLSLKQVSQLLWSGQGVNVDWGDRTSPSIKSVFPLTLYLLAFKIDGLDPGIYRYIPGDRQPVHQLIPLKEGDLRTSVFDLVNMTPIRDAPAIILVSGNFGKMSQAFGGTKQDFNVYLEAGTAVENINLQLESLKLGGVGIANFSGSKLQEILSIPPDESIIYLLPIGKPKE